MTNRHCSVKSKTSFQSLYLKIFATNTIEIKTLLYWHPRKMCTHSSCKISHNYFWATKYNSPTCDFQPYWYALWMGFACLQNVYQLVYFCANDYWYNYVCMESSQSVPVADIAFVNCFHKHSTAQEDLKRESWEFDKFGDTNDSPDSWILVGLQYGYMQEDIAKSSNVKTHSWYRLLPELIPFWYYSINLAIGIFILQNYHSPKCSIKFLYW